VSELPLRQRAVTAPVEIIVRDAHSRIAIRTSFRVRGERWRPRADEPRPETEEESRGYLSEGRGRARRARDRAGPRTDPALT